MPFDFFPVELPVVQPAGSSHKPQCGACGLYKTCENPKLPYTGRGEKGILVLSESPGREEDAQGKLLVGNSAKEIMETFREVGIDMKRDCWLDNTLMCRPPKNKISNSKWIDYCRPHVISVIEKLKPKVIIPIGGIATGTLAAWLWKKSAPQIGAIEPWVGETIPAQKINAWVCPTYHPSYLLRMKDQVLDRMHLDHLRNAVRLASKKRPWKGPQEIRDFANVEVLINQEDIITAIVNMYVMQDNNPVAFDYETNRLKPHGPGGRIRCVGMANHERAVAFELNSRKVIKEFVKFLKSDIPKIAHNAKFEDGWSKAVFGVWPKNNDNCTMITAHVLDGRKGTTSLKFQSFVKLGMPDYDSHISPYLQGNGSYGNNRVFDLPARAILKYCATDALLEWKLWSYQNNCLKKRSGL